MLCVRRGGRLSGSRVVVRGVDGVVGRGRLGRRGMAEMEWRGDLGQIEVATRGQKWDGVHVREELENRFRRLTAGGGAIGRRALTEQLGTLGADVVHFFSPLGHGLSPRPLRHVMFAVVGGPLVVVHERVARFVYLGHGAVVVLEVLVGVHLQESAVGLLDLLLGRKGRHLQHYIRVQNVTTTRPRRHLLKLCCCCCAAAAAAAAVAAYLYWPAANSVRKNH
mmetsp:Transcript_24391/g.70371  ORF Transcript_24391/g.70371 Transcript_24391/m.70371 type:complete len:222 (-) Transcript_24391:22-687(-)